MDKIEVTILNPEAVIASEKTAVAMARLTQRGHSITNMADFIELYNKPYTDGFVGTLCGLPHPTLQKFGVINIAIVGASRRFLAQITRHQNEVKFMSGSLQYSDYSGAAQFVVPYEVMAADQDDKAEVSCNPSFAKDFEPDKYRKLYLDSCEESMSYYEDLAKVVGRDAAGYAMPQGLRNVLMISATPYQWKHMISQRVCRRNTLETQYVMLRCWEELDKLGVMFKDCGPACSQSGHCNEGKMSCGKLFQDKATDGYANRYESSLPTAFLNVNFPLIRRTKHV